MSQIFRQWSIKSHAITEDSSLEYRLRESPVISLLSLIRIMLELTAHKYYHIGHLVSVERNSVEIYKLGRTLNAETFGQTNEELNSAIKLRIELFEFVFSQCKSLGLKVSARFCELLLEFLTVSLNTPHDPNQLSDKYSEKVDELHRELCKELEERKFLYLNPNVETYYSNQPFSQKSYDKFGDAQSDMIEAGKCLAVGQPTACVFHVMRVLECALIKVYRQCGLTIPRNRNWGELLRKIGDHIDLLRDKNKNKSAKFRNPIKTAKQLNEIRAELVLVKDVWRNNTMHPDKSYDQDQAKKILEYSSNLMDAIEKFVE